MRSGTNRDTILSYTVSDAEMQACLTFRDKTDAIVSVVGVRNKLSKDGSMSHLALLNTSPVVWVSEDVFHTPLERIPQSRADGRYFFHIGPGALIKIL